MSVRRLAAYREPGQSAPLRHGEWSAQPLAGEGRRHQDAQRKQDLSAIDGSKGTLLLSAQEIPTSIAERERWRRMPSVSAGANDHPPRRKQALTAAEPLTAQAERSR